MPSPGLSNPRIQVSRGGSQRLLRLFQSPLAAPALNSLEISKAKHLCDVMGSNWPSFVQLKPLPCPITGICFVHQGFGHVRPSIQAESLGLSCLTLLPRPRAHRRLETQVSGSAESRDSLRVGENPILGLSCSSESAPLLQVKRYFLLLLLWLHF